METRLRTLTDDERTALQLFLNLDLPFESLLESLHGIVNLEFLPDKRVFTSQFTQTAQISISREHIIGAITKRRTGDINDNEITRWATMLLLNDAYMWAEGEEDIPEALHALSIGGLEAYDRSMPCK